jgi:nicotinamidase-related amidase
MSYSLILIDLQPIFSAAAKPSVQRACIREIKKAIKDRAPIVFVEFNGYEPTLPLLTEVVKQANYKKAYHVVKYGNDGGYEISQFLTKKHLPKMNMRVGGVNSNFCVKETVQGLKNYIPGANIHVVADACNCAYGSHKTGLQAMKQLPGVKVIRAKGII